MTRLINPNFHVILIHFPLAFLGFGIFVEIFSFLWRNSPFHQAGRWMILLGTLALLPAITSGIFALHDVAGHGNDAASWSEMKQSSGFSEVDWHEAKQHILFTSIASAIALVVVISWLGGSERWRRGLYLPGLLAMLIAMGFLTLGAWRGGGMVFHQGFGVEGKQGVLQPVDASQPRDWQDRIDDIVSPMQLHLIGAGLVIALAAGALGTALRRSALAEEVLVERAPITEPLGETQSPDSMSRIAIVGALYNPTRARVVKSIVTLPVARLWLVAVGVGLLTALAGLYVGHYLVWPKVINVVKVREEISHLREPGARREALHGVLGVSTTGLLVLLAIVARFAPRNRIALGIFALLLALVLAAQVWMGILLLYDGDHGPLTRFQ